VTPAGQQFEASSRLGFCIRLGQDAAAASDDGIRGQQEAAGMPDCHRGSLLGSEPCGMLGGKLVAERCFVQICGVDAGRFDTDLAQQVESPG
jgi:hypothetical protein